jgi:hypothetical protein
MPDRAACLSRLHDLISRHTDGLITPEEHAELTAALAADSDARRVWFLRNDIDLGLMAAAERSREEIVVPEMPAVAAALPQRNRLLAKPGIAVAAAGLMIGVCGASAVWALTLPRVGGTDATIPVFSESFETGPAATVGGLPRGLTDPDGTLWRGDDAEVVTTWHQVEPVAGGRMLRFRRSTFAGEDSPASAWGDVYRLVDARPFLAISEGGPVSARLTASFALAPDACADGEAYSASVRIYAFDRDITDSPDPLPLSWVLDNCVASGMKKVPLVCGETGWQRVSVDASLPPDAKFFLLHVSAVRDVPRRSSDPAVFRGHFVDDISLELHESRGTR